MTKYVQFLRTTPRKFTQFQHLHCSDQILNFTARGGLKYLINITHSHEQYTYTIRYWLTTTEEMAHISGLARVDVVTAQLHLASLIPKLEMHEQLVKEMVRGLGLLLCLIMLGACIRGEVCICDHINWQVQLSELPPSLRWIAEVYLAPFCVVQFIALVSWQG